MKAGRAAYAGVVLGTLLLGAAFFWPSLEQGLFADDYVAIAMRDGRFAAPRGPLDLFNFASGDPADVRALTRLGSIPWWAPPDFRVSFMRPLSSLLWHLDRALFGEHYAAYHLHSIVAWAALVLAAAALYRRVLPLGVALLAIPIFAFDHSLHFPVVWLSNRGGLYAIALGIAGLHFHARGREEGRTGPRVLSATLFAVALAFGEWAFPMLAYVLAYELVRTHEPLRTRVLALTPAAVLGLSFLLVRAALGYGARGSGAYVDPVDEPERFLLALAGRVPVFIADMLLNIPSSQWDHGSPWREDVLALELFSPRQWVHLPEWRFFHAVLGGLACVLLALALRTGLRALHGEARRTLLYLFVGALLSLVPVVGSFPSTRLTMAAFVGIAPLLALVVRNWLTRLCAPHTLSASGWALRYGAVATVLALHVIQPLTVAIGPMVDAQRATVRWVLEAPLDPSKVAEQHVYLLSGSEFTSTFFFAYVWSHPDERGVSRPMPRSVQPLIMAPYPLDVRRTGDSTLVVQALGGNFLRSGQEHMFRHTSQPAPPGARFEVEGGLRVRVMHAAQGVALLLELAFPHSLDDPRAVVLTATPSGLERVPIPPVGGLLRLPRAAGTSWDALERARVARRFGHTPPVVAFDPVPAALRFDPRAR